jgi:lon-related putative ATP-dependent protease
MTKHAESYALSPSQITSAVDKKTITQAIKSAANNEQTFIGQDRARQAISFGLGIKSSGYNIYVMGEQATGRHTLVQEFLHQAVRQNPTPDTVGYINNFDDNREPYALRLKPGEGKQLQTDIEEFINELLDTFPAAFDNPGYQRKKSGIDREFNDKYEKAIEYVEQFALKHDVVLYEESGTISFSPVINGQPIDDKEFANLEDEKRQFYYDLISQLEEFLNEQLLELPQWKREMSEKLRKLKRDTIEQGIKPLVKDLEHKYSSDLGVLKFLRQLKPHLIDAIIEITADHGKEDKHEELDRHAILAEQYLPNILVEHAPDAGAPIIYEPNPTFTNLFGRIEYSNLGGSLFTNYSMIRGGALHKANGGFLLLDADKLMSQPMVWDALILAIKTRQLKADLPQWETGMVNSMTLTPQPINLNVKVILMGSRELYYLLQDYDNDFNEQFRVLADFEHEIDADGQNLSVFIHKVKKHVADIDDIETISDAAISRLVEFSLRQAEHQHRLSARFAEVIELVNEATYFCHLKQETSIDITHVEEALDAKQHRSGRISEAVLDDIKEGQVLISTDGNAVGKVNGLTVLDIGGSSFGTPARISSTVYAGSNGIVDIEREVELGQSIHSKGVLLLSGYLGNKYTQHFPLTISANIAIEQSYGHIDGDSASLAELCALISALTGVPIHQNFAVTGSINQHGEVQSVGGVNEKIEGFFKLCSARGLSGEHGVIIPHTNRVNLVLSKEVVNAVKKGKFQIYAVKYVDEAMEILTDETAGNLSAKGNYPRGSINHKALKRLKEFSDLVNGNPDEE